MNRALNNPLRWIMGAGALCLLVLALTAGQARAATYPFGGGAFSGGAEGWSASGKCNLELPLCTSSAHYDGTIGNPPGSLMSETNILLALAKQFHGEFGFESPTFAVGADGGGQGTVSLQRSFVPKALLKLAPELNYTVTLIDKTNGTSQVAFKEATTTESTTFVPKAGDVALVAGHTYSIAITGEVASTVVEALSLTTGVTTVNFDNVNLTGPGVNGTNGGGSGGGNGGNGGGGVGGGAGLTSNRLETLLGSSLTGSATVKGGKVLVKATCPAKVGVACRVTLQGMLKKGKPATAKRTVKIAKGKSKKVALTVKPKLKKQVAKRKSLLFKETVKAAKAKATVYKSLKLIHG